MKLAHRTADQFNILEQETCQLHQLDLDINFYLETDSPAYRQALAEDDLETMYDIYTQWKERHDDFNKRLKPYKQYRHRSIRQMWRTIVESSAPLPLNIAAAASLGLAVICATGSHYIPACIFVIMSTLLIRAHYRDHLDLNPTIIYSSRMTDKQRDILQEHTLALNDVRVNLERHGRLFDKESELSLRAWKTFQDMQWDPGTDILRDVEEDTRKTLRASYIKHHTRQAS